MAARAEYIVRGSQRVMISIPPLWYGHGVREMNEGTKRNDLTLDNKLEDVKEVPHKIRMFVGYVYNGLVSGFDIPTCKRSGPCVMRFWYLMTR